MFVLSCVMFLIGCSVGHGSSKEQMSMSNKHFKIGAVSRPPSIIISKDKNGRDIIGGLLGKLLEYLKGARNCTFKVVVPDDGLWGYCYGKNNCSGMIGLVNRSEVDFAIGITKYRCASKHSCKCVQFQDLFSNLWIGQMQWIFPGRITVAFIL